MSVLYLFLATGTAFHADNGHSATTITTPDTDAMRALVEQMKLAPRGPFSRIRWYCKDGSVLPPEPGACKDFGGGVQHGEWNEQTRKLRASGFSIANVLAPLEAETFVGQSPALDLLRNILLERFLITADDGWIFRQARFYRGAVQVEDERVAARRMLMAMLNDARWRDDGRFLLLTESARLLPIEPDTLNITALRQLATDIAAQDAGFQALRTKIHGLPDAQDAQRVREYASARGKPALQQQYVGLADAIESMYQGRLEVEHLLTLAQGSRDTELSQWLRDTAKALDTDDDARARLVAAGNSALAVRQRLQQATGLRAIDRLILLEAGVLLEKVAFTAGNALRVELPALNRRERLKWMGHIGDALYGSGLLSSRQHTALQEALATITDADALPLGAYRDHLRYLARVPQWCQRNIEFQFALTVDKLAQIEPLARQYAPDRLRASPLLLYSHALDTLQTDAGVLAGVEHHALGEVVGGGLRALNPGLRRGILLAADADTPLAEFKANGIYLLPETLADLPPVAGILTLGEGSSLSHLQLLARNLGIPNAVVDESLSTALHARVGTPVVLAVSPGGVVHLQADGPQWDSVFGREHADGEFTIAPDLDKLDLNDTTLRPLSTVRATDSGRVVGPKAANLGELKFLYPDAVTDGVVIPFAVFRNLLNQPFQDGGRSVMEWMRGEYAEIAALHQDPAARQQRIATFLQRLRSWIENTDPGAQFKAELRAVMTEVFSNGQDYGVFVRSDTNVEDLPGFTGAGLNLTVPNVVGFENVLKAIGRVWASPFTERAYSWRQAHMHNPEHVYPAILLLKSFASEKSGVMVTMDVDTGNRDWLSIAVNEGVGGAVDGQAAEELRVRRESGETRLLAQASAPLRSELARGGGLQKVPAGGTQAVLQATEITQLINLAAELPARMPMPALAEGSAAADIEFGFRAGRLALFQIRPFVESARAKRNAYLLELDREVLQRADVPVALGNVPGVVAP